MGGGMVKAVWFRGYAPNERPEEFDHVCRAGTAHVLRKRMEYLRAMRGLQRERRVDRAQGLGDPADPGTGRAQPARGHPLPAAIGQDHADARPDRDDRERLCLSAQRRGMARRIPARADGLSQGKHDDQIDSKAQMLDWFKRGSGPSSDAGIYQLYKELAEQARTQTPKPAPLSTLLPILQRW
jgi:hypothetical protein